MLKTLIILGTGLVLTLSVACDSGSPASPAPTQEPLGLTVLNIMSLEIKEFANNCLDLPNEVDVALDIALCGKLQHNLDVWARIRRERPDVWDYWIQREALEPHNPLYPPNDWQGRFSGKTPLDHRSDFKGKQVR